MEEDKGLGDSPTNSGPTDMRHILVTDSTPNTKDDTTYTMYRKSKWDRCLELFIVMFTFVFLISIPLPFLDPTPLREIKDTLSHDSSDMERWEDDEILKGIREHCESLNRYILPIPLLDPFEDQDHEVRPPLIDINVYMERNKSGKFVGIPEEAIFTTYLGNPAPRSVLLSGGVGQGKSTYIKGIIRKWCKRQVTENTKKQMMVYLPGESINGNISEAMKSKIYCNTLQRGNLLHSFVTSGSDEVLLFIDGEDKIKDEKIKDGIQEFIEDSRTHGGPVVLVSSSGKGAQLRNMSFDRHVTIQGFSMDQGLQYAESYFKTYGINVGSSQLRKMKYKADIGIILQNPLHLHILCVAFKHELLQIQDLENLRIQNLYEYMDKLVTNRENKTSNAKLDSQNMHFYRMILSVIVKGKLIITEEDLRNFHLEEKCPLCRLLARGYGGFNRNGEVMYRYTIPHKPFLDHWVARGILSLEKTIRKFFMMYISSEMEWSNSQLILCDLLARQTNKDKHTRVSDFVSMIRYMMIMLPGRCNMLWNQHFLAWTWSGSRLIKNINKNGPNFKDVLMDKVSRDGLFHLLMGLSRITTNDLIYEVDIIDAEIDRMFETNSVYMQDYAWFEAINLDSCSASHIYRCLKEILPEELDNVTQSTLGSLLPYKLNNDWTYYKRRLIPGWLEFPQIAWHYLLHPYYDKYRMRQNGTYFHIQGTPRWGVVETEGETHLIHIWTPIDGPSILQQISVADQQQPSTTNNENSLDNVVFHCDYNRQVFGSPPRSDYSHSSWGKLLKVALGIARDITVVLKNQTLTPSDQIVPILQALHPYSNISLHPEQVTVKYGFISLPDLVKWTDIHFYVQTCGTKVVLFKPIVFVKEVVPDECVWSSTIKAIHNSPFVTLPIWISVSAY